jgi:hypothetical protein
MTISTSSPKTSSDHLPLLLTAWGLILLISNLPDVLWNAVTGEIPGWLFWGKIGVLGAALALCLFWKRLRPLWQFTSVMLVFYLALEITGRIRNGEWWQTRFNGQNVSFGLGFFGIFLLDTAVALTVLLTLWLIHKTRSAFFLVKGQLDAPLEPVRWLGIGKDGSWKFFGWFFAVVAAMAVAIPTILALRPSGQVLLQAASLLPVAILCAAVNAFNEEAYFRLSFLSTLTDIVGKNHILLMSAFFFGMNHWLYGSPPGLVGFLMTAFLAWLIGKSILETRGLLWGWFIHFLPDVVVFASYAIAWFQ